MADLASQLYAAYVDSPTPIPLEQLPKREQEAWARVAALWPVVAGFRRECGRDHSFGPSGHEASLLVAKEPAPRLPAGNWRDAEPRIVVAVHHDDRALVETLREGEARKQKLAQALLAEAMEATRDRIARVLNDRSGFSVDGLDEETRADLLDALIEAAVGAALPDVDRIRLGAATRTLTPPHRITLRGSCRHCGTAVPADCNCCALCADERGP